MQTHSAATEKAVNVAFSWLGGLGLKVRPTVSGELGDLIVEDKMSVAIGAPEAGSAGVDVLLDADKLNSRHVDETLAEVAKVTRVFGISTPTSMRKLTGTMRAKSDDYVGVSLRLTPFERTPNPPKELLEKFMPVVNREADCAARRYYRLLELAQMERDDLWSIGMIYLCVFLHRYQDIRDQEASGAMLTEYLRQEYLRWSKVTCAHLRNVSYNPIGVPLEEVQSAPIAGATMGVAFQGDGDSRATVAAYNWDPSAEAQEEKPEVTESYRLARRASAKAELEDRFSSMTKEKLVSKLREIVNGAEHAYDAQKEAIRRLSKLEEQWKVTLPEEEIDRKRLAREAAELLVVKKAESRPIRPCPSCGKTCAPADFGKEFGFRLIGVTKLNALQVIRQSYCRTCRGSKKKSDQPKS